jgi:lysophospholipase L1-like esterase
MKNTKFRPLALALAIILSFLTTAESSAVSRTTWTAGWSTSMTAPAPDSFSGPNWSRDGFTNHSLRQVIRITGGGSSLRLRFSNHFGTRPLRITGATVARSAGQAAVHPGTVRTLTFKHQSSALVPVGHELTTDALPFTTTPLEHLSITLYVAVETGPATFHPEATATTYRAGGDHRGDTSGSAFTETTKSWYYLAGAEVSGGRGTVVAFGDSITDGVSATVDGDDRYPDVLADRLVTAGRRLTVVNAGISGNRVLNDSDCFGEKAVSRFRRDVLDQPGVRTVIVLEGINDLNFSTQPANECTTPNPEVAAAELIAGHRRLIRAAHDHGIRVVGATITPYKGNPYGFWTPRGEAVRDAVNHWIRTSGEYDAVADFDRALADPADEDRLRAEYDAFDALHPNVAGLRAMAGAVDLDSL